MKLNKIILFATLILITNQKVNATDKIEYDILTIHNDTTKPIWVGLFLKEHDKKYYYSINKYDPSLPTNIKIDAKQIGQIKRPKESILNRMFLRDRRLVVDTNELDYAFNPYLDPTRVDTDAGELEGKEFVVSVAPPHSGYRKLEIKSK